MKRIDEVNDNNSCLNKAAADEPIFVIRAKDIVGAETVRHWAAIAALRHEPEKIAEARTLADQMDVWRQAHVQTTNVVELKQPDAAAQSPAGAEVQSNVNGELVNHLTDYLRRAEQAGISSGIMIMFTPDGQYEIATTSGGNKFTEGGVTVAAGLQRMGFVTATMLPNAAPPRD